jgi:DNA-binding protein HU-beta
LAGAGRLVFAESTVMALLGGGLCPMNMIALSTEFQGGRMNKLEIIDHIAKSADISKAAAGRSLDAAVTAIKTAMKKGSMVTLVGFGTFYVGRRAARTGRNPQTGMEIKIKAARVPKFRPGKALKDAVN